MTGQDYVRKVLGCSCQAARRDAVGNVLYLQTCPKCTRAAYLANGLDFPAGTEYSLHVSVSGLRRAVQREFNWGPSGPSTILEV